MKNWRHRPLNLLIPSTSKENFSNNTCQRSTTLLKRNILILSMLHKLQTTLHTVTPHILNSLLISTTISVISSRSLMLALMELPNGQPRRLMVYWRALALLLDTHSRELEIKEPWHRKLSPSSQTPFPLSTLKLRALSLTP